MTKLHGGKSYDLRWIALNKHVLIVAVKSGAISHGAYIGAVKGEDYDEEALEVVVNGSLASTRMAEIYFEDLGGTRDKPLRNAEPYFPSEWFESTLRRRGQGPTVDPSTTLPRILAVQPVDKRVLLVAAELPSGTWGAYIGAVKGEDYEREALEVATNGSPVPYEVAELYFQDLSGGRLKWHRKLRVQFGSRDWGPAEQWGMLPHSKWEK